MTITRVRSLARTTNARTIGLQKAKREGDAMMYNAFLKVCRIEAQQLADALAALPLMDGDPSASGDPRP